MGMAPLPRPKPTCKVPDIGRCVSSEPPCYDIASLERCIFISDEALGEGLPWFPTALVAKFPAALVASLEMDATIISPPPLAPKVAFSCRRLDMMMRVLFTAQ